MLDELTVNEDGTLHQGVVMAWQQEIENAINRAMTAAGELSATEAGEGCKAFIDASQNVLATSKINVTIKVRPFGYSRFIDVNLGFLVEESGKSKGKK
jgi:ligA